jgi:hypothetical protein
MEHYIPFWQDNETDVLQAVQWLRNHDREAQAMVKKANAFVRGKLNRPAR